MTNALMTGPAALSLVFLFSGVGKLRHREQIPASFEALDIPPFLRKKWVYATFPWFEIILSGLILTIPGGMGLAIQLVALGVTLIYFTLIARALTRPEAISCGCFGADNGKPVTLATLARNALLVLAASAGVVLAGSDAYVIGSLHEGGAWAWLFAASLAAALAGLIGYELAPRKAADSFTAAPSTPTQAAVEPTAHTDDYVRHPTPHAVLMKGRALFALTEVAKRKPLLVIWVQPGCSACRPVVEEASTWVHQLPNVEFMFAVGRPDIEEYFPQELRGHIVVDHQRQLGVQVGAMANPSAVLFGTDGWTAGGPVAGPQSIHDLVSDLRDLFTPDRPEAAGR